MATFTKKSHFRNPRSSLVYQNATFWNTLLINIYIYESAALNTDNSISSKLKYYRKLNGLTRRQLEIQANIPMNSIKKYEDKNIYPNKEVSKKLAAFFKLDTKYFYDSMYEEDLDISTTLSTFMNNNNLSIKSLVKLINISEETVSSWLSNKQPISRKSYYKLKELGVLP